MSLEKNVASQKWKVFAFNGANGVPKTGDAANITAKIAKDWGTATATNDVNPTEVEDGFYLFDLTQAETNAKVLDLYPESSTAKIEVIGGPGTIYPVAANFSDMGVESDGDVHADVKQVLGDATSATDLKDFVDAGYDPVTNKVQGVVLVDTTTANTDVRGTDSAALASDLTTVDTVVDAIKAVTDLLPNAGALSDLAAILTDTGEIGTAGAGLTAVKLGTDALDAAALATDAVTEIANGLLDLANGVETSHTLRQVLRVIFAAMAGKADGLAGTTVHYRDQADGKNRITATVDSNGNRTAVTLDES